MINCLFFDREGKWKLVSLMLILFQSFNTDMQGTFQAKLRGP